ncbi:hypothetical protein AX16_007876 [Volvariella volvacea WC 439]|nr:hypothetical protein AX16_007876 [Volvariella volvacea WC 439]
MSLGLAKQKTESKFPSCTGTTITPHLQCVDGNPFTDSIYLDVWSHRSCSGVRSGGALAGNCHSPGYAISSGMSFTVDHDNDRKRAAIRGREAAAEEAECQQVDTVVFEDENGERVVAKIPAAQMEEVLAAARENNIGRLQQLERVDTA